MNSFSKITDWLLILTNGVSRNLQLHVVREPSSAPADSVRNLTILYHPQPPPGGNGSINLGTLPTIHAQDPHGRSPLHIAIRHRLPLEIIKLLIDLGGNIAGKDDQEVNCLHEALQLAPPVNSTLGNSPGGRSEWTKTYLLPLVEELLSRACSPVNNNYSTTTTTGDAEPEVDGRNGDVVHLVNEPMAWSSDSPLHLALKHNQDISIVRRLLERGAAVAGALDVFGASPLHIVCQQLAATTNTNDIPRKAAIVELLLQHGAAADINTKTADGHTPLHYAIKALYATPSGTTTTTTTGNTTTTTTTITTAGNNNTTAAATTAYTAACFKDNCQVLEMLIAKGLADVSIRNNDGYGAVELASLALAGRIEGGDDGAIGSIETLRLVRIVKLLVKADRERYLKKEDEMGGVVAR